MITAQGARKICNIMEMALKMGAPLIKIADSSGAKITEGLDILSAYGKIIGLNARLSGVIPQIAVIAGPCSGIAAIGAAMCDFTVKAENSGEIYVNPPDAIQETEGRFVESRMYADSATAIHSGSVQMMERSDGEALGKIRLLLELLPSNNLELPPDNDEINSINETSNLLDDLVISDTEKAIKILADKQKIIELEMKLMKAFYTLNWTSGLLNK